MANGLPDEPPPGDLEAQLLTLYADRELLHREIGTADPVEIIRMIRSLEEQLFEVYRDRAESYSHGEPAVTDSDGLPTGSE